MNVSDITIECSPGTFQRISSDPEYSQFLQNVAINQHVDVDSHEIGGDISLNEDSSSFMEIQSPMETETSTWLEAPTKLLLATVEELAPKVGKSRKLKTKKKMWEAVKEKLNNEGYTFSLLQVENKFRSLERQYKKTKIHNKKTGRDKSTCQFENELEKIFAEKHGIFPSFVLSENEESSNLNRSSADETTSEQVLPEPFSRRRENEINEAKECRDRLVEMLEQQQEEAKKQYEERKEERRKREEERRKREEKKEEYRQKKLDLLNKILEKM